MGDLLLKKTSILILIYIEFHVAMNFDKLTKIFQKFPNGALIRGVFKVFFSVSTFKNSQKSHLKKYASFYEWLNKIIWQF